MSEDRTYWHVPGTPERAWHAVATSKVGWRGFRRLGMCGRTDAVMEGSYSLTDVATRLPPTAHLCGNCAASIAARTDIEA